MREFEAGITGRKGEAAVCRELALMRAPALHDVILEDSRGLTQVDHLVLASHAILVLETKTLSGFITEGPQSETWTQHHAGGSAKVSFQNPHRQNHRHKSAVAEIIGDARIPIRGFVISAGKAKFGDALAKATVSIENLPDIFLPTIDGNIEPGLLKSAWERLVAAAEAGQGRELEHLEGLKGKYAPDGRAAVIPTASQGASASRGSGSAALPRR